MPNCGVNAVKDNHANVIPLYVRIDMGVIVFSSLDTAVRHGISRDDNQQINGKTEIPPVVSPTRRVRLFNRASIHMQILPALLGRQGAGNAGFPNGD